MIVLGLDTATSATVAGVLHGDRVFEVRDDPEPGARPAHAERLLGAAEEALAAAGVGWDAVTRLAVGLGPGSFTGLRIGIATARALAQARRIPVTGVSTLEALARGAAPAKAAACSSGGEPVPVATAAGAEPAAIVAVLDARRGEAFAAAWRDGSPVLAPAALTPEALAEQVAALPGSPLAVGDGAVRFRGQLEAAGARVPPDEDGIHRLRAEHVCRLGAEGTPTDRDALLPDYLREPDAVPRPR